MEADDLVTVYTLNDPNKAEIIKHALMAEGIRCELEGEHQAGFTGMFEIEVVVKAVEADRARGIIESHDK